MKKEEKTIKFLNVYHYAILKLLVQNGQLTTKELWDKIRLPYFHRLLSDVSKHMVYKSLRELRLDDLLFKSCPIKHYYRLVNDSVVLEMVSLIEESDYIGLIEKENTCLNHADTFLRLLSPDNSLVSGQHRLFYDTLRHNHTPYVDTMRFVWLEKYKTSGAWYEYKLTDRFFETVKSWRDITRLYNSFKL